MSARAIFFYLYFLLDAGRSGSTQHAAAAHTHTQQQSPSRMQAAGTPTLTRSTPQATLCAVLSTPSYSQHHHLTVYSALPLVYAASVSKELLTDHMLRDAFLPCAPGAVEAHFGSPQAADSATGAVAAAASAAPVAQEVLTLDPAHPSHGAFGPGISGVPPPVVPRYTRCMWHGRGWYAYGVCSTVGVPLWGKLPCAFGTHRTRRRLKHSRKRSPYAHYGCAGPFVSAWTATSL